MKENRITSFMNISVCRKPGILVGLPIFIFGIFACSSGTFQTQVFSIESFRVFKKAENMTSRYFDRSMGYRDSYFNAISLTELVKKVVPNSFDGLLLDCYDDYQGFISFNEIQRYDLRLATKLEIASEFEKPDWLNPMMILVPDEVDAPKQESFLTANIRELRFVKSKDYYAPLNAALKNSDVPGYSVFKSNCLFCHSLKGVGGNKGIDLLKVYSLAQEEEKERFVSDFFGFHNTDNLEKQNMEQFVDQKKVKEIVEFLSFF